MKESGVLRPHVDFDLGNGFSKNPSMIKYYYPSQQKINNNKESNIESIIMTTNH